MYIRATKGPSQTEDGLRPDGWGRPGPETLGDGIAMKLLEAVRSKMNHQTQEAFGDGARFPVNKQMIVAIKRHMVGLKDEDFAGYTFERRRSDYRDAKSDLVVYNAEKLPVLHGREFGNSTSFWPY